jgi:glutathione S-transferase
VTTTLTGGCHSRAVGSAYEALSPSSLSCSRRAVQTVLELGLEDRVELVTVDLANGAQRAPEFLAKNPNGRVPVLVDGDFVLWESNAIMQYLADGVPGQRLFPEEQRARADVVRWMFWNAHHFSQGVSTLNRERMVKKILGQGEPDPAEVARGEAMVRTFGAVLDARLEGRPYLVGDGLTLADIAVASELSSWERAALPLDGFGNVRRWFDSVRSRPSWARSGG